MRGSAPTLGRRVVVTGLAGAGKSTLSLALAARTGLPVVHLDIHFWKPGWVAPSEDEWRERQRDVLAGDAWIADGNYWESLELRLERADSVVALDLPPWICAARALRRGFQLPAELPDGCDYSRWARLRDEWWLALRICRVGRSETQHELEIVARHRRRLPLYVLSSRRDTRAFLASLDAGGPPPTAATEIRHTSETWPATND